MEVIKIEILNPIAKRLIKNLVDLKLITIQSKTSLSDLLENFRKNEKNVPSLDEITKEVEQVRRIRYEKKP